MSKNKLFWKFVGSSALVLAGFVWIALGAASGYRAQVADGCPQAAVSDTFIKTYRMRDRADGYGILSARDGGYLLTGDTALSSGMGVWNAFIVKTDAKGAALWSRQFKSQSAAQGVLEETRRLSAQTTDGNFVVAGDIIDFYDAAYEAKKESWGDVLVTKLNANGNVVWSTMVGDYGMDFPQRLWAASDGGVLLLVKLKKTGYGQEIADDDAVPDFSVVIKFGSDGKVQWSKKMDWTAIDMKYLPDGSFIALAGIDIRVPGQSNPLLSDQATGALPTVIRLDSKLNVLWAKSIEAPSAEYAMPTGTTKANMKINKMKIRVAGGDFRSVEQTPDGGFIAFGRYFNAALLFGGKANLGIKSPTDPIPTVAVKVNAQGIYQWARSIKTANGSFGTDLKTVKTSDNEFIIARTVTRKAGSFKAGDTAGTVELLKADANFTPRWVKKIDIERDSSVQEMQATRDGGIALTGRIVTIEEHSIMGSMEPYEETLLVKADANGNVSGASVITEGGQVTAEDQSSYLILQNMSASTREMQLAINKKVKAKVSDIKDIQRTIVPYAKATVTPVCSFLNGGSTPQSRASRKSSSGKGTTPQALTYPQISFNNAKEAKLETEKSRQIHAELLPILKKIFGQVKMTDNTSGLWLTYYFPRQATVADRETTQKELVKLGYAVEDADGGTLNVSKIGRTLHMTFSINNSMVGKLEVML